MVMLRKSFLRFLCVVSLIFVTANGLAQEPQAAPPVLPDSSGIEAAYSLSHAFEKVADLTTPSLVNISSVKKVSDYEGGATPQDLEPFKEFFGDDFMERFFPEGQRGNGSKGQKKKKDRFHQNGMGTGFLVDTEGHILTNNHVIAGADEVQVTFADDRKFKAKIVGTDERTDIAVIKIEGTDLKPLALGDSDSLKIGEWVIAAGSPFGLSNSITAGIVSAKGRSIGSAQYEDFIQTDAAINPGNSGGPLLNLKGEVVGVNTAIYSRSGGYMGIGFAIPSTMVKQIMASLIKDGKVSRGWLGVVIQPLNEELKSEFAFTGSEGILIGDVSPEGPAAQAGLQEGDIVVALDGKPVKDVNQFRNMVAAVAPNTTVSLEIFRAGKKQGIKAKLGELEKDTPAQAEEEAEELDVVGLTVQNLTPELKLRLGSKSKGKVVVSSVEPFSPAAEAGVQVNDLILKVAGEAVKNADHFYEQIKKSDLKKGVLLVVESSGMKRFIALKEKQ